MAEDVKKQLRIPILQNEFRNLKKGDHLMIELSDDSPHEELILFRDDSDE